MKEFVHTRTIPTNSESQSIVFRDSLYFSSHTNIYRVVEGSFSVFAMVEGTILSFAFNNHNIFIRTEDRVYMNYRDARIGSLKRSTTALDVSDTIMAIGVENTLEVWRIPKEYSFTLFVNIGKFPGHKMPIKTIKILNDRYILTISDDNTFRVFDIEKRTTKIIISTRTKIVSLAVLSLSSVCIGDIKGEITFFNLNWNGSELDIEMDDKLMIGGRLIRLAGNNDTIVVAGEEIIDEVKNTEINESSKFHFFQEEINKDNKREKIESSMEIQTRRENGIDKDVIKPIRKNPIMNFYLKLIKSKKEICRLNIDRRICDIKLHGNYVGMLGTYFVGIFNIGLEKIVYQTDLVKIVGFDVRDGKVCVFGNDARTRIFDHKRCLCVLYNEKMKGPVLDGIIRNKSCIVVSRIGYISVFNIEDGTCYRSFCIGEGEYTHVTADDDGRVLFVSNSNGIIVVDLQISKKLEEIPVDKPVVAMQYYRGYLFFTDFDKKIIRYAVYTGERIEIQLESDPIGLSVKLNRIIVSMAKEIAIYDTDFNYITSFGVTLEGRHRNEIFSKNKPVECVDFDSKLIYCAGQANVIKIFNCHKNSGITGGFELIDKLRVSENREWENYKERLGREKNIPFNKNNFIDVRKIIAMESVFYLHTREGIQVYERTKKIYTPIEFELSYNEEFIRESIMKGNYLNSLVVALHLGVYDRIREIIKSVQEPEYLIRSFPVEYVEILLRYMLEIFKSDTRDTTPIEFIRWACFYHKATVIGLEDVLKNEIFNTLSDYQLLRKTYYLLNSIG